jgi:hypothetical protein
VNLEKEVLLDQLDLEDLLDLQESLVNVEVLDL